MGRVVYRAREAGKLLFDRRQDFDFQTLNFSLKGERTYPVREYIRHAFIWPASGPVLVYGFKTAAQAKKAIEKLGFQFQGWTNFMGTIGWSDPGFEIGPEGVLYYRTIRKVVGPQAVEISREYSFKPFKEATAAV